MYFIVFSRQEPPNLVSVSYISAWIGWLFRIRSISDAEELKCKMLDLCKELKIETYPNYIDNLLKLLMREPLNELSIILEFMTDITDVEEWFNIWMHLSKCIWGVSLGILFIKIKKSFVIYILHHELWSDNDYSQTKFRCNQS